mgnify:CR=1 FL=1
MHLRRNWKDGRSQLSRSSWRLLYLVANLCIMARVVSTSASEKLWGKEYKVASLIGLLSWAKGQDERE